MKPGSSKRLPCVSAKKRGSEKPPSNKYAFANPTDAANEHHDHPFRHQRYILCKSARLAIISVELTVSAHGTGRPPP